MKHFHLASALFVTAALASLTPWMNSGLALALGALLALTTGNPFPEWTRRATRPFLMWGVIGLGAGMDLRVVGKVGLLGLGYTAAGILLTFAAGWALRQLFRTERDTSLLLTVGTAICGGSAIAAVSPVIRAPAHAISVSMATVFLLNAAGLLLFPFLGQLMDLSQIEFGKWSALAIHDTSSVVGATIQYGPEALETGTTIKLARALWIVPVALVIGFLRSREKKVAEESTAPVKLPWFILGFLLASALVTWVPVLQPAGENIEWLARRLLVLTLFLIGAGLTRSVLKQVGFRPLVQAVVLWALVASGSLAAIRLGWI